MNPKVIFGFDMETDIGSWTPFYEGLVHGTPKILEVLSKHNVKATFFFVGEAAKLHSEIVKMVSGAGHEVGCHTLYHETVGDELIPIPGIRPILPEECYHRIEVATDAVEQVLGEKGIEVARARIGSFLTVQEMAGFQMFVANMDDELLSLWDAPCDTPYLTVR